MNQDIIIVIAYAVGTLVLLLVTLIWGRDKAQPIAVALKTLVKKTALMETDRISIDASSFSAIKAAIDSCDASSAAVVRHWFSKVLAHGLATATTWPYPTEAAMIMLDLLDESEMYQVLRASKHDFLNCFYVKDITES